MALENNITSLQVSHCEERSKLKQSVSLIPKLRFKEFEGDWEKKKLGDVAKVKMCKRIFSSETTEIGDIPFYKIGTFGKEPDAFITKELYLNYKEKYSFPKIGDILISASGTLGRTVVYDGVDAYFQDSNIVWLDNNEKLITNSFLFYIYQIVKYDSEGGTIQRLYNSIISRAKFSKPNLPEQQKIASFLTSVDTKIQQLTTKKQLLENYKKGAMQQLFSQQLRFKPDVIARTKDEAISQNETEFPDWEEKKLGEIGKIITGKTPSTSNEKLWNGEIQFITPTDIQENIKFQTETKRTVVRNKNLNILPVNSILYTCIASIGKMCLTTKESITNQQINTIITNKKYNYEYVYYYLLFLTPKIKSTQANTTLPIINKTDFSKFKIKIPSLKEQQKIATYLSAIDDKITSVENQITKTQAFKKGLLQQLFV
jgi:type I restriction enzyme S subunit